MICGTVKQCLLAICLAAVLGNTYAAVSHTKLYINNLFVNYYYYFLSLSTPNKKQDDNETTTKLYGHDAECVCTKISSISW